MGHRNCIHANPGRSREDSSSHEVSPKPGAEAEELQNENMKSTSSKTGGSRGAGPGPPGAAPHAPPGFEDVDFLVVAELCFDMYSCLLRSSAIDFTVLFSSLL